ncbi:uncharacterized protein DUF4231 [Catellatospora citrea]|nr:uncharacterized protein DUF4231 [Catellatospora citrea]
MAISREEYFKQRLDQYLKWYDKKAIQTKKLHFRMRTMAVLGGVVVPVLVNVDFPYARLVTTATSLVVASVVALESLYKYRDQWKNYRSTEQMLMHEKYYFQTRTGVYTGLDDQAAFSALVDRVEDLIAAENSATLNAMTHGTTTQATDHMAAVAGTGSLRPPVQRSDDAKGDAVNGEK